MSSVQTEPKSGTPADSEIRVLEVPIDEIFHDEHFNCRGFIPPSDIIALADEIAELGLLQPITLQPWSAVKGKHYRIVCGHRREAAFRYNRDHKGGPTTIPSIVRHNLTETQALVLNLGENLNRKQLNFMQEARALQRLKDAGMTQTDTAIQLKQTRPWVQVRFYALDLPADIQDEIVAGYVNHAQIHQLNGMTREEQYEAVRHIKDAKIKAGTKRLKITLPKKPKREDLLKAEERSTEQIGALLELMMDKGEVGLHTRVLAWACGNITTHDVLLDFQQYLDTELDVKWKIPEEGVAGL